MTVVTAGASAVEVTVVGATEMQEQALEIRTETGMEVIEAHWLEICEGILFAGIVPGGAGRIVLVKETVTVGVIVVTVVDAM